MTKMEKMQAVVEAARKPPIPSKYHGRQGFDVEGFLEDYEAWLDRRRTVLAVLDAHTEAQEVVTGETVDVDAYVWSDGKHWTVFGTEGHRTVGAARNGVAGYLAPEMLHIATITARVPLPVVPTITATVKREGGQ